MEHFLLPRRSSELFICVISFHVQSDFRAPSASLPSVLSLRGLRPQEVKPHVQGYPACRVQLMPKPRGSDTKVCAPNPTKLCLALTA